jgi:putative flippase GtrA
MATLGRPSGRNASLILLFAPGNDHERSANGRWSFSASSVGAFIQVSISSTVVRIAGMAFGWIAPTTLFGSVVRNAKRSLVVSRQADSGRRIVGKYAGQKWHVARSVDHCA